MNVSKQGSSDPKQKIVDTLPSPQNHFRFNKQQRLLNAEAYSCVFNDAPIRASHPNFLILARFNDSDQARLGLVIAKKHIKRAVGRNCIKRVARESFRLQQHKLPTIDAIVLARRGADSVPQDELSAIFNGLWKRIIKRAKTQSSA